MFETDHDEEDQIRERIISLLRLVARETVRRIAQNKSHEKPTHDKTLGTEDGQQQGAAGGRRGSTESQQH